MTTPTPCAGRCTFHTKRDAHLPCRACQSKHQIARSTAERPSQGLEDSRRQTEGSGPSLDPALTTETGLWESTPVASEPRRARRVRAGSLPASGGARVVVTPRLLALRSVLDAD